MLQTLNQQPSGKNVAPAFDVPREMPATGRTAQASARWLDLRSRNARGERIRGRDKPGGQALKTSIELNFLCNVILCRRIDGNAQKTRCTNNTQRENLKRFAYIRFRFCDALPRWPARPKGVRLTCNDNEAARAAATRAKHRRHTRKQPGLQQRGPSTAEIQLGSATATAVRAKHRRHTTRQPRLQQCGQSTADVYATKQPRLQQPGPSTADIQV